MAHTGFIVASYAVTLGGVLGLMVLSYLDMRGAEKRAEQMRRERRR